MLQFLEQPPFARTHPSARTVLTPEPGGQYRVAVVGNGPLSEEDRARIGTYRNVVRFNDAKNLRPGERTTVHVNPYDHDKLRSPQATKHARLWGIHNPSRGASTSAATSSCNEESEAGWCCSTLSRACTARWPAAQSCPSDVYSSLLSALSTGGDNTAVAGTVNADLNASLAAGVLKTMAASPTKN